MESFLRQAVSVAEGKLSDMKPTRILIADDHPVVRRGLRALLATHAGWEVCGEACTGAEAVEQVEHLKPDVVIIDISMPQMNGFEGIRQIHTLDPNIGILVLTIHDSEPIFRGSVEAGAHAYVLKSDLDSQLTEAVEALCEHRAFFSPSVSKAVLKNFRRVEPGTHDPAALTLRQIQVLKLLAQGKSNKEVASALGISIRTVEAHRYQIMARLKARSLSELVLFAVRNQMIDL
jgi:DNA-binding NarL/FixJ family response regulator